MMQPTAQHRESGDGSVAEYEFAATIEDLREAEERYRAIAEVVADWAYSLQVLPDGEPRLLWTNMDYARVVGYRPSDLDASIGWLALVHPDDRSGLRSHMAALLKGRTDVAEYRIVTRSGEVRWVRDYARPLEAGSGSINAVGGVRDITARRQAELDRARLISELETTNEELERMAASVSRELEDPLAAVAAGLKRLDSRLDDSDPGLDADVQRARLAVLHLREMLENLEELARIGHLPETLETVSLGELAAEAVDLCRSQILSRDVVVEVGDLPRVFGDRIRLLQLLRILVQNAVTYMGDQAEPRLEIGTKVRPGKHVVFVRDNGVGINPADLERVFDVFRRLDSRGTGTGVGLAMARRIVEMHGGRIWAESEGKGAGSIFMLELPA
ncbi:MAG: PAS domain-containing sensor histidine kinase [Gemmatimonadetes bacterium]|nr:PAS domain-containing sensor histidine kinase [Gemmatimonadota bacterium]